ncbi:MAG: isoprenoid biosynthesis glyoxalase ElbB [Bacteroidota bacterium]|jgi:enhancing lycopene biosynthesis protein 2
MKRFAIVLAGSGVYDGSEIHEATLSMYAIATKGATYELFAPNIEQHHVINHLTGEEMPEKRNVLVESARIARGEIKDLKEFQAKNFDALLFPGGFGAAKNLSDFAIKGIDCQIEHEVERSIRSMHEQQKPIGALCISPVLVARLLPDVELTIGQDKGTLEAIEKMGATHKETTHGQVVIDKKNKVVTTPCYMLDANIKQIGDGANHAVEAILSML